MGTSIARLALEDNDLKLAAALEVENHPNSGKDAGPLIGQNNNGIIISHKLDNNPDVLIDFTTPDSTMAILKTCAEKGIAMVIGTTGFDEEQMKQVREASEKTAVLISPNMSVGVNLLFNIVEKVAKMLGGKTDFEIIEAHHRYKKDAPSGTALKLAETICDATNLKKEDIIYGRKGIIGERKQNQICIHSVRSGDIVGEHTVIFGDIGEQLEIVHKARSRDSFAMGALRAAKFLYNKPPGLYKMQDVLGGLI